MFYRSGQVANTSDGQSRTVVLSDIQTPEDRRLYSACIVWTLMMSLGQQYHWADVSAADLGGWLALTVL